MSGLLTSYCPRVYGMSMATTPTTCTIQKASGLCGEPAVTTFIARDGQVYAECAAHSPSGRRIIAEVNYPPKVFTIKAPVAHIILRTRSLADYALVFQADLDLDAEDDKAEVAR